MAPCARLGEGTRPPCSLAAAHAVGVEQTSPQAPSHRCHGPARAGLHPYIQVGFMLLQPKGP